MFNFFVYFLFFIFNYSFSNIFYNGIIQINIKPDLTQIKEDLALIEKYKLMNQKENKGGLLIIHEIDDYASYNGFGIYKNTQSPYAELHYNIAKSLLEKQAEGVEGIYAYYRGYSEKSGKLGRILFPRLDENNTFSIILTKSIEPLIMKGQIPDCFLISYDMPYAVYTAYSTIENKNNDVFIKWQIKASNDIIVDRKIPLNAIIIFADPNFFYFQSDSVVIDNSLNVILPTLYVVSQEPKGIFQYANFALETIRYYKKIHNKEYNVEIENQIHEGKIMK